MVDSVATESSDGDSRSWACPLLVGAGATRQDATSTECDDGSQARTGSNRERTAGAASFDVPRPSFVHAGRARSLCDLGLYNRCVRPALDCWRYASASRCGWRDAVVSELRKPQRRNGKLLPFLWNTTCQTVLRSRRVYAAEDVKAPSSDQLRVQTCRYSGVELLLPDPRWNLFQFPAEAKLCFCLFRGGIPQDVEQTQFFCLYPQFFVFNIFAY